MSAQSTARSRRTIQTLRSTDKSPSEDLRIERCGYITAVTSTTATITQQGVDIELRRAKSSNPVVGEEAIVVKDGTDWWLLDTFPL
jgi:hypothetical protein